MTRSPAIKPPKKLLDSLMHALGVLALALLLGHSGCATSSIRPNKRDYRPPVERTVTATAYCNCGTCCGWTYNWRFQPVYSSGASKGKPKKVGLTASGARAGHGTIAADTRHYPFGTIFYIPGYGYGRVEDRGGAIKGDKIDLWFPSHNKALHWGKQRLNITVWLPK